MLSVQKKGFEIHLAQDLCCKSPGLNVPKLKGISFFAISSWTGNSLCYHFSPLEQELSILLNLGEKVGMLLNKKGMFYQYSFGEGLLRRKKLAKETTYLESLNK